MKVFNKELTLCNAEQVDEFGYSEDAVVYASDEDVLITVEHDVKNNDYSIIVTRVGDEGSVYDISNMDRYDNLEDAQQDLLDELDRRICTLQQIRDAIKS
jgi:hypothetical protein